MLPHLDALFGGQAGGGKQIKHNEKLLVYRNSNVLLLKASEVLVGDSLVGSNGLPTQVIAKSNPERHQFYKVKFDDGASLEVSGDHRWLVNDLSKRAKGDKERGNYWTVLTTEELVNSNLSYRSGRRYAIQLVSAIVNEEANTPSINPYQLGYWLGNGSSQGSVLTCHSEDAEEMCNILFQTSGNRYNFKIYDESAKRATILHKGWITELVSYGWSNQFINGVRTFDKSSITNDWRTWSYAHRLELLQGIMDSDGHANNRGDFEFSSTVKAITVLVRQIMQTLGLKPTKVKRKVSLRENEKDQFVIGGTSTIQLFKLSRKAKKLNLSQKRPKQTKRYIIAIQPTKVQLGVCFCVDAEDSQYVAGTDSVVTHNSDVLLMHALQYTHVPGFSAIILRRSLAELKQSGALLDRASKWLSGQSGVKFSADEHTYYFDTFFKNGKPGAPAKLQFGYLGDFNVEQRYQGAEYQFVGIDEVTHFENDTAPLYLFSRLRKNVCQKHQLKKDPDTGKMVPNYVEGCEECDLQSSVPLKFRLACNPGGPGHNWVKNRYKLTKKVITNPDGTKTVKFIGGDPNKPFIPSSLYDNKFIDQSSYETSLQELDPVKKAQLLSGDWDASPDSRFKLEDARFYTVRGDYFNLGGVIHHLDSLQKVFFTVDPAGSTKAGPIDQSTTRKGKSFTVISVWGLTLDYHLIWMYMRRFRQEIPNVVDQLVDIYKLYKPKYVKMETNGVGLGASQLAAMRGVPVVKNPKAVDKIENAANAIYRMSKHRIWLPETAPWLKEVLDEVFTWTGHPDMTDDIVDTLSDACNDVTWQAQGQDPIFVPQEQDLPSYSPFILTGEKLYGIPDPARFDPWTNGFF